MIGTADRYLFDCPFCGKYQVSGLVKHFISSPDENAEKSYAFFPYALHKMRSPQQPLPYLNQEIYEKLIKNPIKANPKEISDNLILLLGDQQTSAGSWVHLSFEVDGGSLGCVTEDDLEFVLKSLEDKGLVEGRAPLMYRLTFSGWEHLHQIIQGEESVDTVFIAMSFGDTELNRIVDEHIRPAITRTGLKLRKLNDPDGQKAGLIDDRLRLEIKMAKLVLADLTHDNNGAYWEAGYAEGIGKPVVYLCEENTFNKRTGGTHFDTNHHLHILWSSEKIDQAVEQLVACIRATLPDVKQID
ncbi:hypothetical protein [Thalassospira profundimaris]|nr:hypothetical protein [Thalassospira profundimaris]